MKKNAAVIAIALLMLGGCAAPAAESTEQKLTLGTAQRTITAGMSQADVAMALGSPNMVTKDREGIETWIYDKFSSDFAYSTNSGGIAGLVVGPSGVGLGSAARSGGNSSRTQRTLTIIIKFKDSAVKEFTYNATAF